MGFSGRFLMCGLVLAVVLCGCQTIERHDPRKRAAQEHSEKIRKLQLEVMRFADEYVGRSRESVTALQNTMESPSQRLNAQNWKVQQASAAYTVATSLTEFLLTRGDRREFLKFAVDGKERGWTSALKSHYGIESLGELQRAWQQWASDKTKKP